MMKTRVFALTAALLITACSNSEAPARPVPQQLATSDIVSVGTITGFGSVVASGIEFNSDSASVLMDGEPGSISDLRVGMVVSIRGTLDNETGAAEANEIRFTDDAEGPITAVNGSGASLVVLGRTVLMDELTILDGATIDDLAPGNVVQVSGLRRIEDRIQATHIHRKALAYAAGMTMEVKGEISGLDIATQRFNIGTQACDYSAAALELGGVDLANGLYIEASSTSPLLDGDMLLDRVQSRDQDRDRDRLCDSDCDFEIEGYVTSFVSATDFEVDGLPVTTAADTVYINGTIETLGLDIKLAIDGMLNTSGILIADRIVFRLPSYLEIDADIESIDIDRSAISLLGIEVATSESTLFRDRSAVGIRDFGFDDLAIGDRAEVRAYLDNASPIATRLERQVPAATVTLKAPVDMIAPPGVSLLGVLVMSSEDTVFQNEERQVIDAETFFALLSVRSLVKAEGSYDGTSILASKLFLRDCEENCL